MKHGQLRSVGQSLADSLASGISLMTGFYDLDLYGDAARSPAGRLTLDLMNGEVLEGEASPQLATAVSRLPAEFTRLCAAQGIAEGDCRAAKATFSATPLGGGFTLTIEDSYGRVTETDYVGIPAERALRLDERGRVRRKAVRRSAVT